MKKTFFAFSILFALTVLILLLGSSPTNLGPRVVPLALPCAICSAGFAIASAIIKE